MRTLVFSFSTPHHTTALYPEYHCVSYPVIVYITQEANMIKNILFNIDKLDVGFLEA
jgi:hypothetical protein